MWDVDKKSQIVCFFGRSLAIINTKFSLSPRETRSSPDLKLLTNMLAFANAKINLGLFLTEKRADGYHNLETVFCPIKINDVVELLDAERTYCTVEGLAVPGDSQDNLCLTAFKRLQEEYTLPHQHIVLLKNIPIGAGLG